MSVTKETEEKKKGRPRKLNAGSVYTTNELIPILKIGRDKIYELGNLGKLKFRKAGKLANSQRIYWGLNVIEFMRGTD